MNKVGYGDAYPIEPMGKLIAVGAMLVGILALAMPITIIGHNFSEVYDSERKRCGAEYPTVPEY